MYFFDSSILFHKNLLPIHDIQSLPQPIDALTLEVEDSSFIFKFFNFYIFHDSICHFLLRECYDVAEHVPREGLLVAFHE